MWGMLSRCSNGPEKARRHKMVRGDTPQCPKGGSFHGIFGDVSQSDAGLGIRKSAYPPRNSQPADAAAPRTGGQLWYSGALYQRAVPGHAAEPGAGKGSVSGGKRQLLADWLKNRAVFPFLQRGKSRPVQDLKLCQKRLYL